jgi:ABC-type lipoprotein export system ATPase subunit
MEEVVAPLGSGKGTNLRFLGLSAEAFRGFIQLCPAGLRVQREFWERTMNKVIERVMQTFGLMKTMDAEETEQTREVLLDFLSKRPGTDERAAAVEGLTFLKNLKT